MYSKHENKLNFFFFLLIFHHNYIWNTKQINKSTISFFSNQNDAEFLGHCRLLLPPPFKSRNYKVENNERTLPNRYKGKLSSSLSFGREIKKIWRMISKSPLKFRFRRNRVGFNNRKSVANSMKVNIRRFEPLKSWWPNRSGRQVLRSFGWQQEKDRLKICGWFQPPGERFFEEGVSVSSVWELSCEK